MKNTAKTITIMFALFALSACTQMITAPVSLAGATVGAAIDVAGSAAGAVVHTVAGGD